MCRYRVHELTKYPQIQPSSPQFCLYFECFFHKINLWWYKALKSLNFCFLWCGYETHDPQGYFHEPKCLFGFRFIAWIRLKLLHLCIVELKCSWFTYTDKMLRATSVSEKPSSEGTKGENSKQRPWLVICQSYRQVQMLLETLNVLTGNAPQGAQHYGMLEHEVWLMWSEKSLRILKKV